MIFVWLVEFQLLSSDFRWFSSISGMSLQYFPIKGWDFPICPIVSIYPVKVELCPSFARVEFSQESLRKLDLSSTAITGDIQVIGYPMTVGKLTDILLDNTGVFGDIAVPGISWNGEEIFEDLVFYAGWWFGTWILCFHILGTILPTGELIFSEG